MVEHQPRLLGSRVRFPAGAFAVFFRFCQSFTSNFPFTLSLPLSFPSSSFPFLFLSLRPFVCALKIALSRWADGHHVLYNGNKSSELPIGARPRTAVKQPPLRLADSDIPRVTNHTHLGSFFAKKFFENADVSPFGFFRAVGKNREWGYRKGREREELGKVPRSTKKKKTARWKTEG